MKKHLCLLTLFIILISGCGLPTHQTLRVQKGIRKNISLPCEAVLTASAKALREQGFNVTVIEQCGEILAKRPRTWTSYPVKTVVQATPQGENNSLVRISGKRASLLFSADEYVDNVLKRLSHVESLWLESHKKLQTAAANHDIDALLHFAGLSALRKTFSKEFSQALVNEIKANHDVETLLRLVKAAQFQQRGK